MKNIFYIHDFNIIGGTESFLYYLCRKYKDLDITVYYKTGNINQINRLKKYVRVKKYQGEKIICEKAFFNYRTEIIDTIEAKEYIQVIHTDFKEQRLPFTPNPKITKYIGVTKIACDSFKEYTGLDCELCYNPIIIDKPRKILNLVSATRLTKEKGKDKIEKFAKILEENNIPYLWTIFTDDINAIDNPNIAYMKPRLDITDYIANADFLCQLSDKGEGFGYSPAEALTVGTPVIVTPNKSFLEIGVKDGENAFVVDYDLSNVDIKKIYESNLKRNFKYKIPTDNWKNLLAEGESEYKKDLKILVDVKCINDFYDIENNLELRTIDDKPFKVNKVRAEELEEKGFIEIIK